MKMGSNKLSSVSFEQDKVSDNASAVSYVGPENAKEFKIEKVLAYTGIAGKHTYFNFTIKLERMYTDQLIETFFPTVLLCILAYFTIFIKPDDFSERIMVSVTVLLVLAALLTPIKGRIPPTSYYKYIDLWFLWYITYIFSITIFHITLYGSTTRIERKKVGPGMKNGMGTEIVTVGKQAEKSRQEVINDAAKIVLLLPFVLFNLIYFLLQFSN